MTSNSKPEGQACLFLLTKLFLVWQLYMSAKWQYFAYEMRKRNTTKYQRLIPYSAAILAQQVIALQTELQRPKPL